PYTVETSFVQVGQSTRKPWNFYYWPTKSDAIHEPWAGGNGRVDTMGPVNDDQMVATPGGYIAPGQDIGRAGPNGLLETPVAPGSGRNRDELKALWAELGENHYNHRIGDFANEIPPGPPRPGFDECDRSVPRFHQMLETHIRGNREALLGNLRAFPPRGTNN